MSIDHYSELFLFYLKCAVRVRNMDCLKDLNDFYHWYFNSLKKISKVKFWQTSQWRKFRLKVIKNDSTCFVCGSNKNLVLQHTKPYLLFYLFNSFYKEVTFHSWQKYRKLRKLYGKPSKEFVFPFYKKYLLHYFHYILSYMQLFNVGVFCKKCSYKDDIFLIYSKKAFLGFYSGYEDDICRLFYEKKHLPRTDACDRPQGDAS